MLEVARCKSFMTLGREASCDARWPQATAQYKGNRSLSRSHEDSAGLIVPLEGTGQHNPARWEGALLQLMVFNAIEEVLIALWLETKRIQFGNCRGPYITRPSRKRVT